MVFLDFDGTIIDLWPRYCAVFSTLLNLNIHVDEYKHAKQMFVKDALVADYFGRVLPDNYFVDKARLLEDPKYLSLDRLFITAEDLNGAFNSNCLILSKRRYPDNLYWQIDKLKMNCRAIVVDGSKLEWVKRSGIKKGIIIGDSLADLEVAQLKGFYGYMVGYGLNTKSQFDTVGIEYEYLSTPSQMIEVLINVAKEDV